MGTTNFGRTASVMIRISSCDAWPLTWIKRRFSSMMFAPRLYIKPISFEIARSKLIGFMYKRGANIIEEKRRLIHVSGHASQEDIRIMTEAVRPEFVVPIHGEYRMLFRHKEFVKNHLGIPEERIVLIENGDVLELDGERAVIVDKREIKRTFIDESGFEEIEYETVRERKKMAYEGMVTLFLTMNRQTGELEGTPKIVAQGVRGLP